MILAEIELSGCPVGNVFDPADPDWSVEKRHFSGWECPLASIVKQVPSSMRVIEDQGRPVLDHFARTDQCLVTGDFLWEDYTVEAHIRQMLPIGQFDLDGPPNFVSRSGLMLRYNDSRHYYFFCLEGYGRLVLYRREDATWVMLDEMDLPIDRSSYHHLRAECVGGLITCFLDGERCLSAEDEVFERGRAGIRTNTRARFRRVRVSTTEARHAAFVRVREEAKVGEKEEREKYPDMVLWGRIDTGPLGGGRPYFGDIRGTGETELLLLQEPSEGEGHPRIKALTLEGEQVWEQTYPALTTFSHGRTVIADIDGDGVQELVSVDGEGIKVIDGVSGELGVQAPLPESGPFMGNRGARLRVPNLVDEYSGLHKFAPLFVCDLEGSSSGRRDLIIRDGLRGASGLTMWAYDSELNLLWKRWADAPWYGMYLWFWDVDGDGCEEVLAGHHLYNNDGDLLWRMQGAEYLLPDMGGGVHVDHAAFGEIDGDEENGPEIGMASSDPGFLYVDARDGKVLRRHRVGHAQGIQAANFRPDLPGLEMWVGDRWRNFGILTLFSSQGEKLFSFEPDNVSQGGPSVNWTGDGQELLLLGSSPAALGLYDAYGRKVVVFPEGEHPAESVPYPRGMAYGGRVEALDVIGDARDELVLTYERVVYIYTQDTPYPENEPIYAPVRRPDISSPNWIS